MFLKRIRAEHLKGQSFDYELGVGTAIMGPNASGKTAVLDAIKFVCRGKFPEVKKGSWPEASVSGVFDDDSFITRTINNKGSVKTSTEFSVPELVALDVPLLDPELYFGLTDRERTNYVFERIKLPAEFRHDSILAEIERLSFGEEHTEEVESAKSDVVKELRKIFGPQDERAGDPTVSSEKPTLQEALAIAIEKLRERYTYWNRRAKETQGAVTTLTELKLRSQQVSAAAPADLGEQIDKYTKEVARQNNLIGGLKQQIAFAESAIANKSSIEKWLGADRTDYDAMLKKVRDKRQPLEHEHSGLSESIQGVDLDELRRQLGEASTDHKKSSDAAAIFKSTVEEFDHALEMLEKQNHCPYCQSKAKDWKEKALAHIQEKRKKAANAHEEQSGVAVGSAARMAAIQKRIDEVLEATQRANEIKLELKRLGDDIDRITAEKERDTKKREGGKEQLKAVTADPESIAKLKHELSVANTELANAQRDVDVLNNKRTAEARMQQDLTRAGEAAQEHTAAAAQLLVTRRVAKLIDEKRNDMVMTAFEKLLGTANVFCTGILKTPLTLNNGVIARMGENGMIDHHWFSGTEKAIAYIAIATALSASSPFRLVILDEFGRLDARNQVNVINRLVAMQKDKIIDQFVIAGTTLPDAAEWERKKIPLLTIIEVK